ncbi:unnamed protein product [Rhizophagus irregularis]|nr:unnamed protein product [Rhizophagus irregularis]
MTLSKDFRRIIYCGISRKKLHLLQRLDVILGLSSFIFMDEASKDNLVDMSIRFKTLLQLKKLYLYVLLDIQYYLLYLTRHYCCRHNGRYLK